MFTWILIIGGVLLVAGLAWTSGRTRKGGVDSERVRNAKRDNVARGDYFGGGGGGGM